MTIDHYTDSQRPLSMDGEAAPLIPSHRQQIIGVVLVISVATIWVLSAEFIQQIFGESKYEKPYMLSYTCVSMFSVFLLGFFNSSWRACMSTQYLPVVEAQPDHAGRRPLSGLEVLRLALLLAPLFFSCNWTFNLGLAYTSVASSSIIATLTSLFTLIFGALSGVERFSATKLIAALLSIAGVAVIFSSDKKLYSNHNPMIGDSVSVLSALIYAVYTILLKSRAPTEGSIRVTMLLAFIGVLTLVMGWPGVLILNWTGLEPFEWPTWRVALMLTANALIGTVLSDFLWALSVLLTTPLTTTLSLSLTVPLSIILDSVWKRKPFGYGYFFGAMLVFVGFFLVNFDIAITRNSEQTLTSTSETPVQQIPIQNPIVNLSSTSTIHGVQ